MKLLFFTGDFPPMIGGIAVFLESLCLELAKLGHQVVVLSLKKQGCEDFDSINKERPYTVHRIKTSHIFSSLNPVLHTWRYTKHFTPDVLFLGHVMSTYGLGAVLVKRLLKVPYVVLSHGADLGHRNVSKVDAWAMSMILKNASLLLANSRFTAKLISKTGYKGHIKILNPGVDQGRFCPEVDTTEVRKQYSLNGRRVLLTVSRLVAKKNVDSVLRALPEVIKHVPNVFYLIAGDGEERVHLEELTDKLELRSYVCFLGYIENSQLPSLYCASDVFVMPSYVETFGISFLEANACEVPVIAGRSEGGVNAVIDQETGLLVDPHNINEIAEAIIRLLADQDLARNFSENGRRRVEREFSWEKVGERLEDYLTQVLKRK